MINLARRARIEGVLWAGIWILFALIALIVIAWWIEIIAF